MSFEEKQFLRLCTNGQIPELIEYLRQFPEQRDLLDRYERIFVSDPPVFEYPTENPLLRKILEGYYRYFILVFGKKTTPQEGDRFLVNTFVELFHFPRPHRIEAIELRLKWMVKGEGYQFLGGTTSSFRGPYIWKTTEKIVYSVEIPSGTVQMPVYFMKDFLSNSWLSFLSFGTTGTGGWTKRKGLFCRWDDYKNQLELPKFTVSFLKHEAQHLHDFRRYGRLNQTVLEYRAKCCELAYYPDSSLLEKFLNTAKNDDRFSHSLAEYWLISDLSQALFAQDYVTDPEV
jgi:hypothetical protein